MKNFLYLALATLLFSCAEKTAENSKYSSSIKELSELQANLDSSFLELSKIDNNNLKEIMQEASAKVDRMKTVYKSDTIQPKFEEIMLKNRGGIFKTLRKYLVDFDATSKEYEFTKTQVETLKENLIHEKLDEEQVGNFVATEKNSLLLLNGKVNELTTVAKRTLIMHEKVFFQMDSIYKIHAEK